MCWRAAGERCGLASIPAAPARCRSAATLRFIAHTRPRTRTVVHCARESRAPPQAPTLVSSMTAHMMRVSRIAKRRLSSVSCRQGCGGPRRGAGCHERAAGEPTPRLAGEAPAASRRGQHHAHSRPPAAAHPAARQVRAARAPPAQRHLQALEMLKSWPLSSATGPAWQGRAAAAAAATHLVVLVGAVGEVEAGNVHAAAQHLAQGRHAAEGGEGGDSPGEQTAQSAGRQPAPETHARNGNSMPLLARCSPVGASLTRGMPVPGCK